MPRRPRRPSLACLAVPLALVTFATRPAHAQGSGSGSGPVFEALAWISGGAVAIGVGALAYVDIKAASNHEHVSPELAWGQSLVGGGFTALGMYAYGGGFAQKKDGTPPRGVPFWGLGFFVISAMAGGYGTATLLAPDDPKWWGYGTAMGVTALALSPAVGALSGAPHTAETSVTQSFLGLPGVVVGIAFAAHGEATRGERIGGITLASLSGFAVVHGVLDASLGSHVEEVAEAASSSGGSSSSAVTYSLAPLLSPTTRGLTLAATF